MKKSVFMTLLALLVMAVNAALCVAALEDGLVGYYKMDGNGVDSSGMNNHGSVIGATLTTDRHGAPNSAYYFDGVDDSIEMSTGQLIGSNILSVSLWIKPESNSGLRYFAMCSDFGVWQRDTDIGLAISHPDTESAAGSVEGYGGWYHFVGTFDGSYIRVYINGQLKSEYYWPGDIADLGRTLVLGKFSSSYWKGTLDDIRIYDRVLSSQEIEALGVSLSNISFNPVSPAYLPYSDKIWVTFDYFSNVADGIYIFARPFTGGVLTPGYMATGSPVHPQGTGSGDQNFHFDEGPVNIDQIRFTIRGVDGEGVGELYAEFFYPAEYYCPEREALPGGDIAIRSQWTSTQPVIDGVLSTGEWDDAPSLPLYDETGHPQGELYILNDHEAFYILVDVIGDTIDASTADGEYSGIGVDMGLDQVKMPHYDQRYATAGGTENLGIQRVISMTSWTGLGHTDSLFAEGFGSQPGSADSAHTFYEYKLLFSELEIDYEALLTNSEDLFQARINIQAVSNNPDIRIAYPASEKGDWDRPMIRISIDTREMDVSSNEPFISGIGMIPRSYIDQTTGLATTGPGHPLNVTDAPFGAHLRVIGNIEKLRDLGTRYFAVGYCDMAKSDCDSLPSASFDWEDWQFVQDTRTNYYWNNVTYNYVLENSGTQALGRAGDITIRGYEMLSDDYDYYYPNLLFDWRTSGAVDVHSGLYKIHLFAFSSPDLSGIISGLPESETTMTVRIDNTPPIMKINSINYNGAQVEACGITQLENNYHSLDFNISAYDPDGYLENYALVGYFGNNQQFTCTSESNPETSPAWLGIYPSGNVVCSGDAGDHWETSCGYTFQISGWGRAINGYRRIHYRSYKKTITVVTPDYILPNSKMGLDDIINGLRTLTGSQTP